ncbi:NACHT and WD repeat domain-containing protein 2-like [Gigantopelta aegis]|uniref:NACHT and WD repeat domain-containing protein 2-like n=1 Tax=Gigantopelta aegis TaxID=1735272 RepID=UPI001B889679|nr:NACHT and WD repeat domain-containing protein 2-like [Gigantopelta aegis]
MGCNVSRVLVPVDLRGTDIPAQKTTTTSSPAGIATAAATRNKLQTIGSETKPDIEQIVRGNVSLECPSTAKIVRIFTSSTFTDTRHERNTLMKSVYPRLKSRCQKKGYEFQVVDMRWGVRDEATDDHMAAELCLKELDLCKKLSTGPCFVTFLSHKYGYRNFPREIEASEFIKLMDGIFDEEVKRLLLRWFKKDDNAIPSTYILQPISSQIPEFLANDEERKKAGKTKWNQENQTMHWALINAAYRQLSTTRADRYAMSLTEAEISRGVLSSQENISRSIWFYRKIKNIDEQEPDYTLSRYTDCVGSGDSVKDSRNRLVNLRDNKLFRILPRDNIVRYTVSWSPSGIDPDENDEHKTYLNKLCQDFEYKLSAMIDDAIQTREKAKLDDPHIEEVVQHTLFCQEKCRAFQGRNDTLKRISYYLKDSKSDFPLILHGESGSGKTCIMAAAVRNTWRVLGTRGNIIIRFLGTTPDSSNIASLLTSVILQIRRIYGVDIKSEMPMDVKDLFQLFQDTLSFGTKDRPLALFFDSLDQLDTAGGARQLTWLPRQLPEYVKMVISTLTEAKYEIFPRLKTAVDTITEEGR